MVADNADPAYAAQYQAQQQAQAHAQQMQMAQAQAQQAQQDQQVSCHPSDWLQMLIQTATAVLHEPRGTVLVRKIDQRVCDGSDVTTFGKGVKQKYV